MYWFWRISSINHVINWELNSIHWFIIYLLLLLLLINYGAMIHWFWIGYIYQLAGYNKQDKKVYLTAAPVSFPWWLMLELKMPLRLDSLIILGSIYDIPPCQCSPGNLATLEDVWKKWTSAIPATRIFLGLPAAP